MEFRTRVEIKPSVWKINPCERMLFVGSCFADNMGKRFHEEKFHTLVNPHGVMYNPVSVFHTISRIDFKPVVTVITLGTNHVYREKSTGEIVDNCQKRPAALFQEEELTVDECFDYLRKSVETVEGKVIITVSPIRYRKYGYHGSQLSKATLMLAARNLSNTYPHRLNYFPAYEIVNDELRDYRFYQPDMLHPTQQEVEYIYQKFSETYFSDETLEFLAEWRPLKEALAHRPVNPESAEYKAFLEKTMNKVETLKNKYPYLDI